MTDLPDLETLLTPIRSAFHAKRRDVMAQCDSIMNTLGLYRQAVDNAILRELASSHGLPAPAPTTDVRRLALELLDKVQGLPELRQLLSVSPRAPEAAAPVVTKNPAESTEQPPPGTPWPLLRKALAQHPLVIVGGPPHLERLAGIELSNDALVEWVDTTRQGTHAIGNLERRIKEQRISALVLLEGLLQHRHSDPLVSTARHAKVPLAYGAKGGKATLTRALDELEHMIGSQSQP